jgi:hypothetical protein
MKLIESKTLGTAQASIEFTSIPQTFTDLIFIFSTREAFASSIGSYVVGSFNSTTTGYSIRVVEGSGSSVASAAYSSGVDGRIVGLSQAGLSTANTFANSSLYIPNYTAAINKSYSIDAVNENNATASQQDIIAGLWSNTAAITSASFTGYFASNWVAGSTISLYGILKGSDGIVTTS